MGDDVTDPQPLRGGRQRSNQIVTHRIELGLWERKQMEPYIDAMAVGAVTKNVILPAAGLLAASAGAYWAVKQYGSLSDAVQEAGGAARVATRGAAKVGQFVPIGPIPALSRIWLAADRRSQDDESGEQGSAGAN